MSTAYVFQTENDAHARAVAAALLDAAGGDATKVRTVTGQNGRVAYSVGEDLAQTAVPSAQDATSDAVTGARPDENPGTEESNPGPRKAAARKSTGKTAGKTGA